jgi:hypothetical protein
MNAADALDYDDLCPDDDPEPVCSECGAGLHTEEHAYDCSLGDAELNEEDDDRR